MASKPNVLPTIAQLLDLSGRRFAVTGGAQGLGLAIAKRLAEAGATILIGDLNEERGVASLGELDRRRNQSHVAWQIDVRNGESIRQFARRAGEVFGSIEGWVNAAGIFPTQSFLDMTEAQWDDMLDINLRGTFLCGQAASRLMTAGGGHGGVIVNISSTSGHRGRPNLAHYSASKHGIEGLTKSMALELGEKGIRVVSISPALTRTDGLAARRRSDEETGRTEAADLERKVSQSIPLARIGEPDDIARVALFLVSDFASFVSGSTILVDGGQLAY